MIALRLMLGFAGIAMLLVACRSDDAAIPKASSACVPDQALVVESPVLDPDRRIEDIEFALTGLRYEDFPEGVGGELGMLTDNLNFGGVWGDSAGGIIVAVLDCGAVDVNELATIAGGVGRLEIIEVPHTYRQVTEYRDTLRSELGRLSVEANMLIDSTLTGRHITVEVLDLDALPGSFGDDVPADAFSVAEVDALVGF